MTVPIKIGLLPEQEEKLADAGGKGEVKPDNKLGISVTELTAEQREMLEVAKNGVLVKNVGKGPAKDAGIQPGDVVLRIQSSVIKSVADFDKVVKNLPEGKSIALLVQRRGNPVFLALKIGKQ